MLLVSMQREGTRMAIKVFSGGPDFKSLRREIDVVKSLPHHENIVRLDNVEEDVSALGFILRENLPWENQSIHSTEAESIFVELVLCHFTFHVVVLH